MTGFARSQGQDDRHGWAWELKTVNNRGFDLRVRLPQGNDALESAIRKAASGRVRRGSMSISLAVKRTVGAGAVRINQSLLKQFLTVVSELDTAHQVERPRVDGLLALPGMVEVVEDDEPEIETRHAAMMDGFVEALDALVANRREEGKHLAVVLSGLLDTIAGLAEEAAVCAATQPAALRDKFERQVQDFLAAGQTVSEERLAQEIALLASKADVREELDRLRAHVAAARELLEEPEPIGRKLDFLCQEFNREVNTLCSKSSDLNLTRIGLALKAGVDQLREQVQNIE